MNRGDSSHIDQAQLSMVLDLYGTLSPEVSPTPPSSFRIFSFGTNDSDQGEFVFDTESAEKVMAFWRKQARDLVIDYEHQSNVEPPIKAEAAGWFVPEVRGDGLYATNVRWTEDAYREIQQRKYRFISPTVFREKASKRVVLLKNLGVTNNPSLFAPPALIAARSNPHHEEKPMPTELEIELQNRVKDLEGKLSAKDDELRRAKGDTELAQLSQTVGLAPSAKVEEVRSNVVSLVSFRSKVCEIAGKDSAPAALGVIETWKSEAAEAGKLRAEKQQIEEAQFRSQLTAVLDESVKAGKIPPSKREFYEKKALTFSANGKPTADSVEWLKGLVEDLPVINNGTSGGSGNETTVDGKGRVEPPAGSSLALLSQRGIEWAKQSGSDPEKVAAWVAQEKAAGRLQ